MIVPQIALLVLIAKCSYAFPHELDASDPASENKENPFQRGVKDAERALFLYAPGIDSHETADAEKFLRTQAQSNQIRNLERVKRAPHPVASGGRLLDIDDEKKPIIEAADLDVTECSCAFIGDSLETAKSKGMILSSIVPKQGASLLSSEPLHFERKPKMPDCECFFVEKDDRKKNAPISELSASSTSSDGMTHKRITSNFPRNKRAPLPTSLGFEDLSDSKSVVKEDSEDHIVHECYCGVSGGEIETAKNLGLKLKTLESLVPEDSGPLNAGHRSSDDKFIVENCSCMIGPVGSDS